MAISETEHLSIFRNVNQQFKQLSIKIREGPEFFAQSGIKTFSQMTLCFAIIPKIITELVYILGHYDNT